MIGVSAYIGGQGEGAACTGGCAGPGALTMGAGNPSAWRIVSPTSLLCPETGQPPRGRMWDATLGTECAWEGNRAPGSKELRLRSLHIWQHVCGSSRWNQPPKASAVHIHIQGRVREFSEVHG